MAVTKKRKGAVRRTGSSKAKVKKLVAKFREANAADPRTKPWSIKLHSSRLMYLRNDPDFLTMVKIGRVMNALTFCVTNVITFHDMESHTHIRQLRRTQIMLGGFLHEAILLVDTIKGRYLGNAEFEPLRALVLDHQHLKIRKQAKKVRNYLAFHLDGYDETTRTTIAEMKPATYTLSCGENQSNGAYYFEFADFLDMYFLGNVFPAEDDCPPDEAGERVMISLVDYALEFITACHKFQVMLWDTKVKEHVY